MHLRLCLAIVSRTTPVLLLIVCLSSPAAARLPADAPPLPPPGGGLSVVNVSTAQQLADACWNLQSNQAIVIAAGTYNLAGVNFPNGQDGRLTVGRFGATAISNIQIRGATGHPEDVTILGDGMLDIDETVPFGFQIFSATDVTIADLSVGEVYYHAVAIQNDQGATRVRLYHLRLFDAGQQIVKANRGSNDGAEDVIIEYCDIFHTQGAINHPQFGNACYTNGIDAIGGRAWIIRDNLIRNIYCQDNTLAGPSVLMWQGSADTLVERNTFLNNSRGVALGLSSGDHTGGLVRNNFFRWSPGASYAVDVAISTASPNSKLLHNTVVTHGEFDPGNGPVAVEVRYATTTGVEVRHNLMDAALWNRDGVALSASNNLSTAQPSWFENEGSGDLRLTAIAAAAIDQADRLLDAPDHFTGGTRPPGTGLVDIGAHERCDQACLDPTTDGASSDGGPTDGAPGGDGTTATDATPAGDPTPSSDAPRREDLRGGCSCGAATAFWPALALTWFRRWRRLAFYLSKTPD